MSQDSLRNVRAWIFRVVGGFVILASIVWAISTFHFVKSASIAQGKVTELRAGGSHPEVQFTTSGGLQIRYPQNGFISGYRVGDSVSVLYDPDDPNHACIDSFGALWGFNVVLVFMGLVFIFGPGTFLG